MNVFVTGATGVIGSRVVPLLLNDGHRVSALARSAASRSAVERLKAVPVEADIFDVGSLRRAMAGHDAVINLATSIPSSAMKMMLPGAWRANDRIRREGSAAVASAAKAEGVGRMIQESFAPIYPDHGDEWIDEAMAVAPAKYNRTALDAERSAQQFSLDGVGVVLRFAALYGPDVLLAEMLDVMRRGWSPLPGSGTAYFSSLSQDDAATAVVAALGVPAGVYNIVEDDPMRRGDWVRSLARAAGIGEPKPIPQWLVAVGGSMMKLMARSQRISNVRFKAVSRWAPKYECAGDAWRDVLARLPMR